MDHQEWKNFPQEPQIAMEGDPGQLDYLLELNDEGVLSREWKKWMKERKSLKKDVVQRLQ